MQLGLGKSTPNAKLLTLLLEGVSLQVLANILQK
jgi:hypothetical protein